MNRLLLMILSVNFAVHGSACLGGEPEDPSETTRRAALETELLEAVSVFQLEMGVDIWNSSVTPRLLFNAVLAPDISEETDSVTATLHVYEVDPDPPSCATSTGLLFPVFGVEKVTTFTEDVTVGRPLVISLEDLPEGNYFWTLHFDLVLEDGTEISYPLVEPPVDDCDIDAYNDKALESGFLAVVPTFDIGTYSEVIPGWNDPEDVSRFNIIFYLQNQYEGYSLTMEEAEPAILHMLEGEFGLLNAEPYASNAEAFNFWIYDDELPLAAELNTGAVEAWHLVRDGQPVSELSLYHKIAASFPYDGARSISVLVQPSFGVGGKTCAWNDGAIVMFPSDLYATCLVNGYSEQHCLDVARADRVFTHEIAHIAGGADEAYFSDELFDPSWFETVTSYPIGQHITNYMTYYSLTDVQPDCELKSWGKYYCYDPSPGAVAECEANSWWSDLIGNGCGEPGVIDCTPEDPLYEYEVTCQNLGSGRTFYSASDLFKSTVTSIMDTRLNFLDVTASKQACQYGPGPSDWTRCATSTDLGGRVFGEPAERQLCVFLDERTGGAEGVCQDLCLDRCAAGQSCIAGECYVLAAPGDATGDGNTNVSDTQCIIRTVLSAMYGIDPPSCLDDPIKADLNCDGVVTMIDVQLSIDRALSCGTGYCNAPMSPEIDVNQDGVHDQCNAAL